MLQTAALLPNLRTLWAVSWLATNGFAGFMTMSSYICGVVVSGCFYDQCQKCDSLLMVVEIKKSFGKSKTHQQNNSQVEHIFQTLEKKIDT